MKTLQFAERLKDWATISLLLSVLVLVLGAAMAYGFERTAMSVEILGHWLVALGAFGIKSTYIARLAALDEIAPHPEGRGRERQAPGALVPLHIARVREPEPSRRESA